MTTEQARKEIVEETLTNRDELRRALIEGLENDVGDGFLDCIIAQIRLKKYFGADFITAGCTSYGIAISDLIVSTEKLAISYANSVNIEEEL